MRRPYLLHEPLLCLLCSSVLFSSSLAFSQDSETVPKAAVEEKVTEEKPSQDSVDVEPSQGLVENSETEVAADKETEAEDENKLKAEELTATDSTPLVLKKPEVDNGYAFGHSTYNDEPVKMPSKPSSAQIFTKHHLHVYGISGWSSELGFTIGSMGGQFVSSVLFDGSGGPSSVGIGYQTIRPGIFLVGNRDIRLSLSLPNLRVMGYYWWADTGGIASVQSQVLGVTLTGDRAFKWYVNLVPAGVSGWLAYGESLSGPVYSVAMDFTTEVGIWW